MKKKGKNKPIRQKGRPKGRETLFKWQNIRIGYKYGIIFVLIACLFITAGVIVYLQLNQGQKDMKAINNQSSRVNEMAQLASIIQGKDVQIADYLLTEDYKYVNTYKEYEERFNSLIDDLKPTMKTEKQTQLLNGIVENDQSMNESFYNEMVASVQSGQETMANSLRAYSTKLRTQTIEDVNNLMQIVKEEQVQSVQSANERMNSSIAILALSNLAAIIIGTILVIIISRRISGNLHRVVNTTFEVAKGNLRVPSVNYQGRDEIGKLAEAVNHMKDNISSILLNVNSAAEDVLSKSSSLTHAANEVKHGNEQVAITMEELSNGAETQANSASELSGSMHGFVQKVLHSEEGGQEIALSSTNVLELTNKGTTLMHQSVSQMKQIDRIVSDAVQKVQGLDKQSNEISKLVLVIKSIADQTNLLSLNAAIEAARAGEHGRGFAVVADEVRKLSEQVTSSVSEITAIVQNIQSETDVVVDSLNKGYAEVKEGTSQIKKTGESFEDINSSVSNMANKINLISNNLKEIANNSSDMNNLIEEIASVSEESAAGVEQAAASAQQTSSSMEEVSHSADELAELANQLNEQIKTFKL